MTAGELAPAVLAQLGELDVFNYELSRYVPCAATAGDGTHHDRLLVIDRTVFATFIGSIEDRSISFVAAATLASVGPSPDAVPGRMAEVVRRCPELRMGSTLIRLRLDDGSEVLYETGRPSFPGLPAGRHVVDAECGEVGDEERFDRVDDLHCSLCLVTNAEFLRTPELQG